MAFAADILFPLSCALTKGSLCLTYLRLFPSRTNKIFCYGLIGFVVLYTVACIFLMLFQYVPESALLGLCLRYNRCTPIRGYWDASAKQSCINLRATLVATAALNSFSDFLVYLLVYYLSMRRRSWRYPRDADCLYQNLIVTDGPQNRFGVCKCPSSNVLG